MCARRSSLRGFEAWKFRQFLTKDLQFPIQRAYVAVDVSKPTLTRNAANADAEEPSTAKPKDTKQRRTSNMCNYFSCIITENLKVHWLKNTAGHEDILASAKLEDKKLTDRDFVRIEIVPKNDKRPTRNKDDWNFKVDEERTLPDWYEKNVIKAQKACWVAWEESVKIQLVLDDERHEDKDTFFMVYGSGLAVVNDSGRAEVYGSGRAVVYGSGLAVVYDSGLAEVYDSGKVELKSTTSVAICNGKIFVHSQAQVIVKDKVDASKD